jgi:excisionase family DNA binding protein
MFGPTTSNPAQCIVAGVRCAELAVHLSKGNHWMGSMALNELGKMLTAAEVAEMLHLHVNTVKRLGDRGELKYYRVCKRGDRRFLLEDVRRFLDNNR